MSYVSAWGLSGRRAQRGWGDRYPASVATTWAISIGQMRAESPLADDLLQVCAFLHPDAIPAALAEHILLSCGSFGPGHSAAWQLEKAVRVLMRFSLLGRRQCAGPSGQPVDALSMRRLVQLVVRSRLDDAAGRRWAQVVVQGVASHADTFDASQRWAGLKALAPQLQVCAGHVSAHHLDSDAALRLLRVYSDHLEYGSFQDAAEPISAALALASSKHGAPRAATPRRMRLCERVHLH